MPFKTILRKLTKSIDGYGAILLDEEGEVVDMFSSEGGLELDVIGAHKGIILKMLERAVKDTESVHSIGISTEKMKLTISPIKEGYYVVVLSSEYTPLQRVIRETSRYLKELEEEMG